MDHRRTESNHHHASNTRSTDLSFIPDNDLVELVWENGQITMQGQSSKSRKTWNGHLPSKIGKFGSTTDCIMNDFPLIQDDDMVPWLNYHNEDPLNQDFCSDFLTGLSGITENDQIRNSHSLSVNNEVYKPKTGQLYPSSSPQSHTPFSLDKPRASDISSDVCDFSSSIMSNQDPGRPSSSSNAINFSHFSRPTTMIKAKDKVPLSISKNPAKLTLIDSKKSLEPFNLDTNKSINVDASKVDEMKSQDVNSNKEKITELAVASSSVCSASSVDKTSKYPKHDLKRKLRDTEESDCPSEDVEEESIGVKKASLARGCSGSKRSRAAEVHNLSERRRRDRINEKMRALQELVPNCNKVDKASMLDEAIEYLKTLQLQVQMMSMGAGLYMPHMRAAHMAHFSHMGMGMIDVNGGSLGYPVMQGPHYRAPLMTGPSSFHGPAIAGPSGHMFGLAGQGIPMQMPPSSMAPLSNTSLQVIQNTDANSLMASTQALNEAFEQPALVLKNDQAADVNGQSIS